MSESRGESRSYGLSYVTSSESRSGESRCGYGTTSTGKRSSFEDIDSLISRLERTTPKNTSNSPKVKEAIDKRQKQLEELKQLRDEAKKREEEKELERKELERVESENKELAQAINKVKKIGAKKNQQVRQTTAYYNSCSESHDSGESRW